MYKCQKLSLNISACVLFFGLMLFSFFIIGSIEANAADTAEMPTAGALSAGTTYTLTGDVSLSGHITVSGGNTVIDLNGCTVTGGDYHIIVYNGGSLTIQDSSAGGSGKIAGCNSSAVIVQSGGTLVMNGGRISDNANTQTASYGGVYVCGGTFTMNGGTVSGNSAVRGGGVYIDNSGAFVMLGGKISGNTAKYGGGVCAYAGTFVMNRGEICENIVEINDTSANVEEVSEEASEEEEDEDLEDIGGLGGGVFVYENSTFTMNDGTISGNEGEYGGGVCDYIGDFIMNDGKITGNTANKGGGAVYVNNKGYFDMNEGEITENISKDLGGAVRVAGSGTADISCGTIMNNEALWGGGIHINDGSKVSITDSVITKNTAKGGGGILVGSESEITVKESVIKENTASKDGYGYGGGVYVGASGKFTEESGTIYLNTAATAGADVYSTGGALNLIDQSTQNLILNNHCIDGWYYDNAGDRWSIDSYTALYSSTSAASSEAIALTAAYSFYINIDITKVFIGSSDTAEEFTFYAQLLSEESKWTRVSDSDMTLSFTSGGTTENGTMTLACYFEDSNPIYFMIFEESEDKKIIYDKGSYLIEVELVNEETQINGITHYSYNSGKSSDGEANEVKFTNYEAESLTISKAVSGIDTDLEFSFTLTVYDGDGNKYTGSLYNSDETVEYEFDKNGTYSFSLKAGSSINLYLPYGYKYTVSEAGNYTGYNTTATVNSKTVDLSDSLSYSNTDGIKVDETVQYTNTLKQLPGAGGTGLYIFISVGLILCISSIVFILVKSRRKAE